MSRFPHEDELFIGPQGPTWRQRAKLAQMNAKRLQGRADTPSGGGAAAAIPGSQLRLVGTPATDSASASRPFDQNASRAAQTNAKATRQASRKRVANKLPMLKPNDPRWVLALRAADALDHTMIVPEKRERLIRLGRSMGLNPFDTNLIIAIVQDQARRGTLPEYCASAGHDQLAMVALPRPTSWTDWFKPPLLTNTLIAVASLLGLQGLLIWWLLG